MSDGAGEDHSRGSTQRDVAVKWQVGWQSSISDSLSHKSSESERGGQSEILRCQMEKRKA